MDVAMMSSIRRSTMKMARLNAFHTDVQEVPLENVGARCIEQIEHRRENDDE